MKVRVLISLLFVGSIGNIVFAQPVINNIGPPKGYPGQIVAVYGTRLVGSTIRWTSPTGSTTTVDQSLGSARYFQIPRTASPGKYSVVVEGPVGSSAPFTFEVLALKGEWPAPRIEDITMHDFSYNGDGTADIILAVPAANIDPGADVSVCTSPTPLASEFFSAIPSDYFIAHDASTYGYPIYHYGMHLAHLDDQPLGVTLEVVVRNTDGQEDLRKYSIPKSVSRIDSDNDGILDNWEKNGYTPDVGAPLPLDAMGARLLRKDIFVEVDWIEDAEPSNSVWPDIRHIFQDAPVLNPDGSAGISIHIDRGQGGLYNDGGEILADHCTIDFCTSAGTPDHESFYTYKASNFRNNRLGVFHYGVLGRNLIWGASGHANLIDDDFIVTVGDFPGGRTNETRFVGTFIHELGHNFGLLHGGTFYDIVEGEYYPAALWDGADGPVDLAASVANEEDEVDPDETYKPNQSSSMNYRYQWHGVSIDSDVSPEQVHTYSQGMFRVLDEKVVNEADGIADNEPVDLNHDTRSDGTGSMDTNNDGDAEDIHHDYDEWGNLRLNFRLNQAWRNLDTADCCTGTINVDNIGSDNGCDSTSVVVTTLDDRTIGKSGCPNPASECGIGEIRDIPCGEYVVFIKCGPDTFYWSEKGLIDTLTTADTRATADTITLASPGDYFNIEDVFLLGTTFQGGQQIICPTGSDPGALASIAPAPSNGVQRFRPILDDGRWKVEACESTFVSSTSDRRTISDAGRFSSDGTGKIRFITETTSDTIDISIPAGLLSSPVPSTRGTIEVTDYSTPGGADKKYMISDNDGMFLAFIWKNSDNPIDLTAGGLRMGQSKRKGGERVRSESIEFRRGDRPLPRRRPHRFSENGQEYVSYVHTSEHRRSRHRGTEDPHGYLLRAVVIRNR